MGMLINQNVAFGVMKAIVETSLHRQRVTVWYALWTEGINGHISLNDQKFRVQFIRTSRMISYPKSFLCHNIICALLLLENHMYLYWIHFLDPHYRRKGLITTNYFSLVR